MGIARTRDKGVRLQSKDRADYERVLHQAMSTARIRDALLGSSGGIDAAGLRERARRESGRVMVGAEAEYRAYVALRTKESRAGDAVRRARSGGLRRRGLLSALAVMAPVIAGSAAVIFLLLGYALELAGVQRDLAESLVLTGWAGAGLAALTAALGILWLLVTVARHRASPPHGHTGARRTEAERAREAWREALLEHGMLPFLARALREADGVDGTDEADGTDAASGRRGSTPGYSSPDYSGPDYTGPDYTSPRKGS
ncbi:hypothetical protein ACWGJ2_30590 [Streptomyces sp. NPDC054796]